ncbi:MAG: bifunctional 5,10-methylenetetrahydrofolate dehydrogenase/5,10-methenyltetrahydrofolate cyclohydrolase [Candidatus Gracilibacteria bacterium]|nr:bifunctional 5,10-methylenetetrahydrofolate dehydrogenase/5,10-methenyltetrahydrofolate cyclohydrolase [Candidatus Gracilibacteria bacterium]
MLLDGRLLSQKIYKNLKQEIEFLDKKPKLSVILVGENNSSLKYIAQKQKWSEFIGIDFELIKFDENIDDKTILEKIDYLNNDKKTSGFIVQLPLPKHLDEEKILNSISPQKDVDGFHPINQGKIVINDKSGLLPCTPAGIIEFFREYNIDLVGKNAVVVGRSNIVGKPIANMLINAGATVSICNSKTKDLNFYTKNADIIVMAIGVPKFLKVENIKKDAVIIDVGFSVVDGKIYGDCDFENIFENHNPITPVPGGVGMLTVAMLLKNTIKACK